MVSPKRPTSSSSDDVRPFLKHSEVDDAPPSVKRPKRDDNVDALDKKLVPSLENPKELCSTDQPEFGVGSMADQKVNDTADKKVEAAADGKVDAVVDGKGDTTVEGENPTVEVNKSFLAVGANKEAPAAAMTCFIRLHQGKWVALLDRKGSGHVQVNGKTISKYSFCFLNSGDEVILSQAENNAYIVQLLLESPSDVGTSAGKGKLLNIENQVEDALAIACAFDLSVFSNPCRDLFSLKPTSQLDGPELDSAANIGSNNAADFELSIGTGNAKSFSEPFLLAFLI
ncbi:hypothetical protein BC332_16791 [Capsicum chinense]|nr:hypothetical protein BC332_16791 [Capsicum chinense]